MNSCRAALAATIAMSAFWAGTAWAQPDAPVVVRAEDCLKAHVDRVVADDSDLRSAADFLINYACADAVSSAQTYETNLNVASEINAMWKTMNSAMTSTLHGGPPGGTAPASQPPPDFTVTADPETGDLVIPPAPPGPIAQMLSGMMPQAMRQVATLYSGGAAPVRLRALAGDLVVDAYERQHVRR